MASLDLDGAVQSVKTMLSELTAWQTITGTTSAAEAAKRIHEGGVAESEVSETPLIILEIDDFPMRWDGGRLQAPLVVDVRIELEIPHGNRGCYADEWRWFHQQLGSLLAGINGVVRGDGALMLQEVNWRLKPGRIDPDTNDGRLEWMAILGFSVWLQ
jgi:hypothetical protein